MKFGPVAADVVWDRDTLLIHLYNFVVGWAVNKYAGRAPMTRPEIEDLAVNALFSVVEAYLKWCDHEHQEPDIEHCWNWACQRIDWDIGEAAKQQRRLLSLEANVTSPEGDEWYSGRFLQAARDRELQRRPSLLLKDISDYIATFPTQWKVALALRFHEQLSPAPISRIIRKASAPTTVMLRGACEHVVSYALSQTLTAPFTVPPIAAAPWVIPFTVHRWVWLNTKHPDIHAYLGAVQHAYAADDSLIADMLKVGHGEMVLYRTEQKAQFAPCGTYMAWKRHRKKGEPIDAACEAARVEHNATKGKEYNALYRRKMSAV